MDLFRDLAAKDLLSTLDGQTGDLLAQGLAGTHDLLIGFGLKAIALIRGRRSV